MIARILIVSAIVFTLFLDLGHEGLLQRTCCREIYELSHDIELARELLSIEEVTFQSEVFAVLHPTTVVADSRTSVPVSEDAVRTATRNSAPPNIAAAHTQNEEVPGL